MPASIEAAMREPDWLPHRYDPGHDAVHLIHASRDARRRATFLTDAELGPRQPLVVRRRDAVLAASPSPLHFVFHSAYCCSTLIARALDRSGNATSLKEPQILNDLVGWRHRGGASSHVGQVLSDSLRLLARPFVEGEAVVLKPSNVVNGLAEAMLLATPNARAILLYAPLDAFVTSIARKGMWGRLWVRDLLSKQLADGLIDLGFAPSDYLLHTDLQVAAVGWLAQQALFGRLAATYPQRVRILDSEELIAAPAATMARVASLFDLALDATEIDAIVAEEFSRDAKSGSRFVEGRRERDKSTGESLHADEIEKVVTWAMAVADQAGVEIVPGRALHL